MRIITFSQNKIGKLIYFDKPVFKMNKLLDNSDEFTEKLKEITSLNLSDPIYEPINPSKILGKERETLKYNYVGFKESKYNLFDKVIMGFGENGYYYDIYFNFKNEENNLNRNEIQSIIEEFESEIIKTETLLEDYYVIKPYKAKKSEISNFVLNIEFKKPLEYLFQTDIANQIYNLAGHSEMMLSSVENNITFNFTLNLYPKLIDNGFLINPNDIVVPDRVVTFTRNLTKPKKLIYYIRFRGIPAKYCLDFLELIDKKLK